MLLLGVDDMVLFSSRYNEALILQVLYTVVYPSWQNVAVLLCFLFVSIKLVRESKLLLCSCRSRFFAGVVIYHWTKKSNIAFLNPVAFSNQSH